jgi:hypothetical protein
MSCSSHLATDLALLVHPCQTAIRVAYRRAPEGPREALLVVLGSLLGAASSRAPQWWVTMDSSSPGARSISGDRRACLAQDAPDWRSLSGSPAAPSRSRRATRNTQRPLQPPQEPRSVPNSQVVESISSPLAPSAASTTGAAA